MTRNRLYTLLNLLALALYALGHAVVGTFVVNTRIIGTRDSRLKEPAIVLNWLGWPLVGALAVLLSGGPGDFLASLARPASLRWLWRVGFTFLGARYIRQELWRARHPRPYPDEVTGRESRVIDMHDEVAASKGIDTQGLKGLAYKLNEYFSFEVTRYELRLERLPREFDGFTIVQLSDLHYGKFTADVFVDRYVNLAIERSPDLIALTGDFQHYSADIRGAARRLAPIGGWSRSERGGRGAVAVLGNHDTWAGTAEVTYRLRQVGINTLRNSHVELRRGDARLYIAGIADPWSLGADMDITLHGIPAGACTVLLCHVPDLLAEASDHGVDLQLSGHLHGGQIKLPLVGPLLSPSRYNRRYVEGFFKRGRTIMYTSRGLGGHPPIRWNCKPEVVIFVLRSK